MNKIKFIYFDLGGVFFHWRSGLKILAERFGVPFDDVQGKGFEGVRVKYDDKVCKGLMTTDELWGKYKEELGIITPKDFNFAEEWVKTFTPIPESHRFLERYVKESALHPVGVLTNVYPEVYDWQIKYGLVPDLNYQTIIRSDQVGFVKPDPEIFKLARGKAGVENSEILYADDQQLNVEAANKMGWQAVWFKENNPEKSIREIRERLEI